MISLRKSSDRGHFDHGWLNTYHSFSFAGYYDSKYMGFRALRVINEDWVAPGRGFPPHDHRDMEIVTIVLEGSLEHKDSMGNGSIIRPGDVQRMSAGTGVTHSEFNSSTTETVHLLQIWLFPEKRGITPGYEQQTFPTEGRRGRLQLIASRNAEGGSVRVHQDVMLYVSALAKGARVVHTQTPGRYAWLQLTSGVIDVNGTSVAKGDGAMISEELELRITSTEAAEFILFDLA